jgi:hypothetical protein
MLGIPQNRPSWMHLHRDFRACPRPPPFLRAMHASVIRLGRRVLVQRGNDIVSVAGSSMGALGGAYAAGRLDAYTDLGANRHPSWRPALPGPLADGSGCHPWRLGPCPGERAARSVSLGGQRLGEPGRSPVRESAALRPADEWMERLRRTVTQ